jgi:hypothetical protein
MLHTEIRRNCHELEKASRLSFNPLWFSLNHLKYRYIEYWSMKEEMLYPKDVSIHALATEYVCVNDQDKAEPPDFILEAKKKGTKKWVVGTPKADMWRHVCNNFNSLETIPNDLMLSI